MAVGKASDSRAAPQPSSARKRLILGGLAGAKSRSANACPSGVRLIETVSPTSSCAMAVRTYAARWPKSSAIAGFFVSCAQRVACRALQPAWTSDSGRLRSACSGASIRRASSSNAALRSAALAVASPKQVHAPRVTRGQARSATLRVSPSKRAGSPVR